MRKPTKEEMCTPQGLMFFALNVVGFAKFVYEGGMCGAFAYIAMFSTYCLIVIWKNLE